MPCTVMGLPVLFVGATRRRRLPKKLTKVWTLTHSLPALSLLPPVPQLAAVVV